jgi:2-iminoacetate synthase ThiH
MPETTNVKGWSKRYAARLNQKAHAEERAKIRALRAEAAAKALAVQVVEPEPAPAPVEPTREDMLSALKDSGLDVPETTADARVKELYETKIKPVEKKKPKEKA